MVQIGSQTVLTTFTSGYNTQAQSSGDKTTIQIGAPSVMVAKPVSYEFRVVEHVKDGQIVKVGLQYQVWEHDNYGSGIVKQYWTDVGRVQKDVDTGAISDIINT